jgi:cell division protein FtsQ
VRQASVQREFPDRLRVTLEEHKPVAFWGEGNDARMVNSFGEVFDVSVDELDDNELPRLSGPDSQSHQVLTMYQDLAPRFKELRLVLNGLELSGRGSWRARLGQGAVIELGRGSVEDVLPRVLRLVSTLGQITQRMGSKIGALESADLRHDNGYALRLRGVSTVVASAKKQTPTN